jgi:hypothetical protein
MANRMEGLATTLDSLVEHTLSPLMRRGDTLGMWSYNQELITGEFPLQRWEPEAQTGLRNRMLTFARTRWAQKPSTLSAVLPALERLTSDSAALTVFVVTTGEEGSQGLPADDEVNRVYAKWRKEQQRVKMPYVIVLRFKEGKSYDFSITPAPFPVKLAPMPRPPEPVVASSPAATTPVRPVTNAPAPPPPIGESLILSGRKGPKPEESTPAVSLPAQAPVTMLTNLPAPTPIVSPAPPAVTHTAPPSTTPPGEPPAAIAAPALATPPVTTSAPAILTPVTPLPSPPPAFEPTNNPATPVVSNPSAVPTIGDATNRPPLADLGTAGPSPQKVFWLLAVGIGIVVLGGAAFLVIRNRQKPHVSLITRSLEKHHEDHTP